MSDSQLLLWTDIGLERIRGPLPEILYAFYREMMSEAEGAIHVTRMLQRGWPLTLAHAPNRLGSRARFLNLDKRCESIIALRGGRGRPRGTL